MRLNANRGLLDSVRLLAYNPNYMILFGVFSLCLGHLNALAALIGNYDCTTGIRYFKK
jgi:hypothetical protein